MKKFVLVLLCLLFSNQFLFAESKCHSQEQKKTSLYINLNQICLFRDAISYLIQSRNKLSVNEWTCPKCGYDNPYWNTCCTYCGEINW